MILNREKDCYENDKERFREKARDKNRNLSEKDKNKRKEYGKNRYHNMSEEKKQKLKEYREAKSLNIIMSKIVLLIIIEQCVMIINKSRVFYDLIMCMCYLFSRILLNPYTQIN